MAQQAEVKRIGLVITGGTIGSEFQNGLVDVADGYAAEMELLESSWTGIKPLDVHISSPLRRLSENLAPRDWLTIAEATRSLIEQEDVSGVLLLHGTDTAAYTAAALTFLLSDLTVPVVLTGSNLPPTQDGSDAHTNVRDALIALSLLEPGVFLSFAGIPGEPSWVHLGTHVRKKRASGRAFYSINREPIAKIQDGNLVRLHPVPPLRPMPASFAIDERVLLIRIYPGLNLDAVFQAAISTGIKGIVVELYPSATGPHVDGPFSLTTFIQQCVQQSISVVTTVNAAPGKPSNEYSSTAAIRDAGATFIGDMLPETATVKLMWALAQSEDPEKIAWLMTLSVAGETNGSEGYEE